MTHTSGLRPDLDLTSPWTGHDEAIRRATEETPTNEPGRRFVYSDINYFVLGEIVARVSGKPLDVFARERIFAPLGMRDTTFKPPASLRARIAPTQKCTALGASCDGPDATILRGVVHDPTARRMGGVAGHAGLFSTAADLSRFCRMLLNGGVLDGARVLAPLTIARMTSPASPAGDTSVRGLGWDLDSAYSSNRGGFCRSGRGHGFTGTSLWIDPATRTHIVFCRTAHPNGAGDVTAGARRHDCRVLADRRLAGAGAVAVMAPARRVDAAGRRSGGVTGHTCRHRRSARGRLHRIEGPARRSADESHGRARDGARRSIYCARRRT